MMHNIWLCGQFFLWFVFEFVLKGGYILMCKGRFCFVCVCVLLCVLLFFFSKKNTAILWYQKCWSSYCSVFLSAWEKKRLYWLPLQNISMVLYLNSCLWKQVHAYLTVCLYFVLSVIRAITYGIAVLDDIEVSLEVVGKV